eukprot:10052_1
MAESKEFSSTSTVFNALQSQLQQQFIKTQQLKNDIDLLSTNKPAIIRDEHKLQTQQQTTVDFCSKHLVPNVFTNNIIQSITCKSKYTDVTFHIYNDNNNKQEFYAIRSLFAMHSNVFEHILYKNKNQQNETQIIEINDKYISPSIFEIIIYLFYGLINMKTD